jgi:D-amino-acid dehydrogenase
VIVIGAGIVGAAASLRLVELGAEVIVVDDDQAGRATYAGAGIVSAPWRQPGSALFDLTKAAVAAYPALVEGLGPEVASGFAKVGMLFVAPEGQDLEAARMGLAAAEAGGHLPSGSVTVLDPPAARRAFPYLRPDLSAVHLSETSRVHGEGVRIGLLAAAVASGAVVKTGGATLIAAKTGGDTTDDGTTGRVTGAVVAGERIEADAVLVAAGAWSSALVAPLGVGLAVEPQRGQILHLAVTEDTAGLPVARPAGGDHYLLPFADRRIVVGATRETGAGFDPRLTAAGVAHVLANALDVAPGLAGATVVDQRVGLRPASADGLPLLGAVDGCQGLWVATGMGHEGLTLGPYGGQLVADAILGRRPEMDLAPFAPTRGT